MIIEQAYWFNTNIPPFELLPPGNFLKKSETYRLKVRNNPLSLISISFEQLKVCGLQITAPNPERFLLKFFFCQVKSQICEAESRHVRHFGKTPRGSYKNMQQLAHTLNDVKTIDLLLLLHTYLRLEKFPRGTRLLR